MSTRLIRLVAIVLASFTMAAADDGCDADKSLGGNDPDEAEPVSCGTVTCAEGEVCCDEACGLCGASDQDCGSCPAPQCGEDICGDGETCCEDTCCLPTTAECSTEACNAGEQACGEDTCDTSVEACCEAPPCTTCLPIGEPCSAESCM